MHRLSTVREAAKQAYDLQLIQNYRAGDERAAELLFWKYSPKVLGVCKSVFHGRDGAEDAAQKVWMRVLVDRRIDTFRGESGLWTWLYRVTVNTCHDHLAQSWFRKVKVSLESPYPGANECLPLPALNPEEQQSLCEEMKQLTWGIYRLQPRYRKPLLLVCLRGYTYAEAALELKIPMSTLGVRLNRAKKQLLRIMT